MALMALDGPRDSERIKVYDAVVMGPPIAEFDFGGVSASEFANSGRASAAEAIATKQNPTQNLDALISHIDTEIANPNTKGLSISKINAAQKELTQWAMHPAASTAQSNQISNLIDDLDDLKSAAQSNGVAIGYSPTPGVPQTIPTNSTPNKEIATNVWQGIDTTQATPRVFFYAQTPMGIFQTPGTPVPSETAATDNSDLNNLFTQIQLATAPWLTANGYAGSGNVQTAQSKAGIVGNFLDPTNPMAAIEKLMNFYSIITSGSFVVHNPKQTLLQNIGKDVSTAAKAVSKVVTTVAKTAVKAVNTVIKLVKTVELAPARVAFLGMVEGNIFGLASSFNKLSSADMSSFWGNFAPDNPSGLQTSVNKGKGHNPIAGPRRIHGPELAAAIAVPILTAAIAYLKAKGVLSPAEAAALNAGLGSAAAELGVTTTTPGIGPPVKMSVPINPATGLPYPSGTLPDSGLSAIPMPVWLGIGAAGLVVGFMVLKSKKKK